MKKMSRCGSWRGREALETYDPAAQRIVALCPFLLRSVWRSRPTDRT